MSQGQERVEELLHLRVAKHASSRKCAYSSQTPKPCQPSPFQPRSRGQGPCVTWMTMQLSLPMQTQKATTGWFAAGARFLLLKLHRWQSHRELQIKNLKWQGAFPGFLLA